MSTDPTERDHDYEREKWEEDHCPECRALVDVYGNCRCLVDDLPCSELGGEKSDCPHWQNGCCICQDSDNQHRTLLVDVLNYRRGLGRYDLSKLPEDERSMAALDAWEELEARIENAL